MEVIFKLTAVKYGAYAIKNSENSTCLDLTVQTHVYYNKYFPLSQNPCFQHLPELDVECPKNKVII